MLAVNPRTTWTWPQQSPSLTTNNHSTKRKKDTIANEGSSSNTKTSFSDQRASIGITTTLESDSFVNTGVVGRQILPSAGSIFHDQIPCEHIDDAEPASKVIRITESETKMNLNCIKSSCNTVISSFNNNNNNNTPTKGTKPINTTEKRKMWLKRKKKSRLQINSENKQRPILPQVFTKSSSNGNDYSVTNNIDSIETRERSSYDVLWNNSRISNPFLKRNEEQSESGEVVNNGIHPTKSTSHDYMTTTTTNSCDENDESAKNRLLDILLSDKEREVNQANELKHESAIKKQDVNNESTSKKGGRLFFVKKFSHFSSRPSSSSQAANDDDDEAKHKDLSHTK